MSNQQAPKESARRDQAIKMLKAKYEDGGYQIVPGDMLYMEWYGSGMDIKVWIIKPDAYAGGKQRLFDITYLVASAIEFNTRQSRRGTMLRNTVVGADRMAGVTMELGRALFPDYHPQHGGLYALNHEHI